MPSTPPSPASLLLVEDEVFIRSLLRRHLQLTQPQLDVFEAGDGVQAWSLFRQKTPVFAVVDIMLPGMDGNALLRLMARHHQPPRVMVLTACSSAEDLAGLRRDLNHFIWMQKGTSLEQLDVAFGDLMSARPITLKTKPAAAENTGAAPHALTPRERIVLSLIASGQRSRGISEILGISLHTIHVHRRNIMRKLHLHSTPQLVVYAIKHGLTKMERP